MRVDKFLWCVRKFKTRSIATDAVKKERVFVNEEKAKPSKEVKKGDKIHFKKEGITFGIEVLEIPKSRLGAKLVAEYVVDCTDPEELQKSEFISMMRNYNRAKGAGRPTKKERRSLEDFMDWDEE